MLKKVTEPRKSQSEADGWFTDRAQHLVETHHSYWGCQLFWVQEVRAVEGIFIGVRCSCRIKMETSRQGHPDSVSVRPILAFLCTFVR